jgi:two-component sensor histidine kinase
MNASRKFHGLINKGVKSTYAPWEIFLTRKLNYLSVIGFFNVSLGLILFSLLGEYNLVPECGFVLLVAPLVVILNTKKNYIWGAYLFFVIGIVLFFLLSLKMGYESYIVLFYFPILISVVQLLGRRETFRHMVIILSMFFVSIVVLVWLMSFHFLAIGLSDESLYVIRPFNMLISFFSAIALIAIVTAENTKQEDLINQMLHEKEILMAEVFHRVKNNLNIVTSLLNLRKHASESNEVRDALDDCRNRVFSMALVHQKIYTTPNVAQLNFSDYLNDLIGELVNSFGGKEAVDCRIDMSDVELRLADAIPCGLIVNELVTNAFKYARTSSEKLAIDVHLSEREDTVFLEVLDNGPGFDVMVVQTGKSLGMELIRSLSEQLDAEFVFSMDKGCHFRLSFHRAI